MSLYYLETGDLGKYIKDSMRIETSGAISLP